MITLFVTLVVGALVIFCGAIYMAVYLLGCIVALLFSSKSNNTYFYYDEDDNEEYHHNAPKKITKHRDSFLNSFSSADDFAEYATEAGYRDFGDYCDEDEYWDAYEDAADYWRENH